MSLRFCTEKQSTNNMPQEKYRNIISLGGGCDIADNLNFLKLRTQSLFFDWIWNLDGGLFYVTDILKDKFSKILNPENYTNSSHYLFKNKYPINKFYPTLAFMHHDIIGKDRETFIRRAKRLDDILSADLDSKVLFIYYRVQNSKEKNNDVKSDYTDLLKKEVKYFIEEITEIYPKLKFDILVLLCLPKEKLNEKIIPDNYYINESQIYFDAITTKRDQKYWHENWRQILSKYIPIKKENFWQKNFSAEVQTSEATKKTHFVLTIFGIKMKFLWRYRDEK